MKISDRILSIVNNEGISIRYLEQSIGCSNGVLSRSIQKWTDISSIWLSKIIELYPAYNSAWLLTGSPPMIINGEDLPVVNNPGLQHPRCRECQMKDRLISSLQSHIKTQEKLIKRLEDEKCSEELEQKRKAVS